MKASASKLAICALAVWMWVATLYLTPSVRISWLAAAEIVRYYHIQLVAIWPLVAALQAVILVAGFNILLLAAHSFHTNTNTNNRRK